MNFLQVTLSNRNGDSSVDVEALWWDEFTLDPVRTNKVKVEAFQVYSKGNNGFVEIEFYGTVSAARLSKRGQHAYCLLSAGYQAMRG